METSLIFLAGLLLVALGCFAAAIKMCIDADPKEDEPEDEPPKKTSSKTFRI
jgi:hypothetical protein